MDTRSGWVEKGGSRSCSDKKIMERIMLRFRPIAPKPVTGGPATGSSAEGESREVVKNERKKRKYVRVKQTRCKKDKKKELKNENIFGFELLQEKISGFEELTENGSSINLDFNVKETLPVSMKLDNESRENKGVGSENIFGFELLQPKISVFGSLNELGSSINLGLKVGGGGGGVVDQVDRRGVKVVESWMVVEGVSVASDSTWFGEGGLGSTDMEKLKNLEIDMCPGLVSDGFDRVQWVNLAYRKLVDPPKDDEEPAAEVVAWLVVKEKLPVVCKAFACTVRVVSSWRNNNRDDINNNNNNNNCNKNSNRKYISQTMPCDVWRMDFGGFVWRLDSNAALSLGR